MQADFAAICRFPDAGPATAADEDLLTEISPPEPAGLHTSTIRQNHFTAIGRRRSRIQRQVSASSNIYTGSIIVGAAQIENRDELAGILKLPTETDDITLFLHSFCKWGPSQAVTKIRGEFAVIIWVSESRELYAYRNRLGIRQIYYICDKEKITLTSNLVGLAKSRVASIEVDQEFIATYLFFGHRTPASERTAFARIRRVRPGHFVSVKNGTRAEQRYWFPESLSPIRYRDPSDYVAEFYELLTGAVKARLVGEPPFWFDVSGGLDSTSVLYIGHQLIREQYDVLDGQIICRSIVHPDMPEFSELDYIDAATKPLGLKVRTESFLGLPPLTEVQSERFESFPEPSFCLLALPETKRLCEAIRASGASVHLTGHGADHLLVPPSLTYLRSLFWTLKWGRLISDVDVWTRSMESSYLQLVIDRVLFPRVLRSRRPEFRRVPIWLRSNATDYCKHVQSKSPSRLATFPRSWDQDSFDHACQGAVVASDIVTASRQYGVEKRLPYTDVRLLEFVLSISAEERVRPPLSKHLLRKAMTGRIPEKIVLKTRQPPGDIPFIAKLRRSLADIDKVVQKSLLCESGFIDNKALAESFERLIQGDTMNIAHFCTFLTAELWIRRITCPSREADPVVCSAI